MEVRVFCPCREEDEERRVPATLWDKACQYPLEWLYYCDVCLSPRCPRCTQEEVVCRFCPSCLFEVTTASAKTDNNRCMRSSCFECPECFSAMSVVKDQSGAKYTLDCNYCRFQPDITFDKSMPIGRQLTQLKAKSVHSRFHELKRVYHKQAVSELTGSQLLTTFNQVLEFKQSRPLGPIELTEEVDDVREWPKMRQLVGKLAKRCKGCRTMLVKPETKPTVVKYKTRLLAMNHLPRFRLTPHYASWPDMTMAVNQTFTFRLNVTNPLPVGAKIRLATTTTDAFKLTMITPSFELGPAPELWDEVSLVRSHPSEFITRQTAASDKVMMDGGRETGTSNGFFERGANWISVLIEIVPLQPSEEIKFGLFTNLSYNEQEVGFWTVLKIK